MDQTYSVCTPLYALTVGTDIGRVTIVTELDSTIMTRKYEDNEIRGLTRLGGVDLVIIKQPKTRHLHEEGGRSPAALSSAIV